MRTCTTCVVAKPLTAFGRDRTRGDGYRRSCKDCRAAAMRARRADGRYAEAQTVHRRRHSLRAFGLTVEQYDEMLAAQDGVCAMCHEPCATGRRLAVDHDHQTGAVRGLLCGRCNTWLGIYEAIKDRAAAYLAAHLGVEA